jgi:putative spermidine/putrescine transport system substrate-binding protein
MTDALAAALNRRLLLKYATAAFGAAAVAPALRPFGAAAQSDAWATPPDQAKAAEQAKDYHSYGMPDDWANYGEVLQKFAAHYNYQLKHTDDQPGASSLQEIDLFDKEKGNPVAVSADIGLLWGAVAEQREVVPSYSPPSAEKLPQGLKAVKGGWVATFTGVPAFVVNTDLVKDAPKTWDDLLKPEFKGKIASPGDPRASGTAQTTFIAWAYAHGGDESNMQPAIDFAKKIVPQYAASSGSAETLQKGEHVIWLRYDFNCAATADQLKKANVNAQVVIPGVSIYAPSALMINKYNTAKKDVAQLFLDYVLSDDAQTAFAKFGARPIRYVLGDLKLPDTAKANWLPDADYAQVVQVKDFTKLDAQKIAKIWDDQVASA